MNRLTDEYETRQPRPASNSWMRVALEKALLSGASSAAAEQQERNEDPLSAVEIETVCEGEEVLVAGWPVARQHPGGRDGTVFVTVEDEAGDVQLILRPRVFARCRRELESQALLVQGVISRWDVTTNIIDYEVERVDARDSHAHRH